MKQLCLNQYVDQPGPRSEPEGEVCLTAEPFPTPNLPEIHPGDPCPRILIGQMTFDGKATTGAWFKFPGHKSVFLASKLFHSRYDVRFLRKGETVDVDVPTWLYRKIRVELMTPAKAGA